MSSDRHDLAVVLDAPELGPARPVGVLTRWPGHVLSVGFAFARSWLRSQQAFPIDRSLPLVEHTTTIGQRRLPGAFSEAAPDAWGLLLRRQAGHELDAWGYLIGVADSTRMGALRFREGVDGPFVSDRSPAISPMARLRELRAAARRFEEDPDAEIDASVAELLASGSSLGGARPKANFVDPDGRLWIAKFPAQSDRRDIGAWEQVYVRLAAGSGIEVPETRLMSIGARARTFMTRRFDRWPEGRRLYVSAQTMSGHEHAAGSDYVDVARAIRDHVTGDAVRDDLAQMFRRMAFNVLAGCRVRGVVGRSTARRSLSRPLAPPHPMDDSSDEACACRTGQGDQDDGPDSRFCPSLRALAKAWLRRA